MSLHSTVAADLEAWSDWLRTQRENPDVIAGCQRLGRALGDAR